MKQTDMGARLKARRLDLGMSQQQVADMADVSPRQIAKFEKGPNSISRAMPQMLAAALDVSPVFFLADNETVRLHREAMRRIERGV